MLQEEAKKDAKRNKKRKKEDLPTSIMLVNKRNDPTHVVKRQRMILPAPQVSDRELEEVRACLR